jgi:hypothetical protein
MSVITVMASATRPDSWDLPLFLHIFGGMVMVGALTLSLVSLIGAWRGGSAALTRLGFRSLLYGAVPAFLVMRIAAQWLLDKEGLEDADFAWIDVGFMTTDMGVLFLIVATVLVGRAARRAGEPGGGGPAVSARVATGLVSLLLVAYLVAVWAMTTKPV